MKNRQIITLLYTIGIGLATVISVNAGFVQSHITPDDLRGSSEVTAIYSTPNDLSTTSRFYSTPNDLQDMFSAKYFNLVLLSSESDHFLPIDQSCSNNLTQKANTIIRRPDLSCLHPQLFRIDSDSSMLDINGKTTPSMNEAVTHSEIVLDSNDFIYDEESTSDYRNEHSQFNHSP